MLILRGKIALKGETGDCGADGALNSVLIMIWLLVLFG